MAEKHACWKEFTKGLLRENPTLVGLLGMCPTLAVTSQAVNALGMGLATMFVLVGSNLVISALRKVIPAAVKLPCYIVIIAGFTLSLLAIGSVREILGCGTWMAGTPFMVTFPHLQPLSIFTSTAGGFLTLGVLVAVAGVLTRKPPAQEVGCDACPMASACKGAENKEADA